MIFSGEGRVADDFFVAGLAYSPCYVLKARRPALFESGYSCTAPLYERDIRRILDGRIPEILFLTHVHYDHCGTVSDLKKAFPGMKVAASERASQIMRSQGARELMTSLSESACRVISGFPEIGPGDLTEQPFQPFDVDMVLRDGQSVTLGEDLTVRVLATPGHTRDMLSYYIPERRILIGTEAIGCLDANDHVITEFLADYDAYVESLRRLMDLDIDVLCQGHRFVFTGPDAGEFLRRSLAAAETFREKVESVLVRERGSIERTVLLIKEWEWDVNPGPKQPEKAYLVNLTARVKHIAGRMRRQ